MENYHDRMDELFDAMKIFVGKLKRKVYLVDPVIGGGMALKWI
jgi:hypothetical protein